MSKERVQTPEVPVIIIENDDEQTFEQVAVPQKKHRWLAAIATLSVAALMLVMLLAGYKLYRYFDIGLPVSVSPAENIAKLKQPITAETAEVVLSTDSILGVALDLFALHGLSASIEMEAPKGSDRSVFLYSRCADYTADGNYLGSLVVQGDVLQTDRSRLGYMAMANNRMVIGISRSDKVKDYAASQGGSFFRQFVLLSDGVMPSRFYLHGKVERRAIGRIGETLYYVSTRHKETLWDFADALREYGFIDAIYITGGDEYGYYRTRDGARHDFGNAANSSLKRWGTRIPWLVFRKQ